MIDVQAATRNGIDWALRLFDRPVMTSAFGLNGMVLIHVLKEMGRKVPVLFVNTGFMFPETLALRGQVADMGLDVMTYRPKTLPMPCDEAESGFCEEQDEEQIAFCCATRKVEPMRRALAALKPDVILTPRGRFQAVTRHALPFFEGHRKPPRVNPLTFWSQEQVERYIKDHGVPHNPLHDDGYYSVGCWPCTRPVGDGEDVRAGRWDGLGRVECGIWT